MSRTVKFLLIFFLTSFSARIHAQKLPFDHLIIDCIGKYIASPMNATDSTYIFGVVYVSNSSGLNVNTIGKFKLRGGEIAEVEKMNGMIINRIQPTQMKVAILSSADLKKLDVSDNTLLGILHRDTATTQQKYMLGFINNQWRRPDTALKYLNEVKAIDPTYKRLDFEMAFSYNVLKQYEKAIEIAKDGLSRSPGECLLYKELVFSELQLGKLEEASKSARKGIGLCTDSGVKMEIAANVTYFYYTKKDVTQFKEWVIESKKWLPPGHQYLQTIQKMEEELLK